MNSRSWLNRMSLGKRLVFLQSIVAAFMLIGVALQAQHLRSVPGPNADVEARHFYWFLATNIGGLIAMGVGTSLMFRTVQKPIRDTIAILRDLVSGKFDLSRRLPNWRCDELGELNKTFNEFLTKQQDLMCTIYRCVDRMNESARLMNELSMELDKEHDRATEKSSIISDSALVMKQALEETAVATQRLLEAMDHIRANAGAAANESKDAATAARGASSTMSRLGEATTEIQSVVKLISTIAEQTNLLSLNATIEAARAGELGKGFAVVATEVKELAKGSASATVDINRRISSIQSGSDEAIGAIEHVRTLNEKLSESAANVLTAAEQQDSECKRIVEHVAQIRERSEKVASSLQDLEAVSQSSSARAGRANRTSIELNAVSAELMALVDGPCRVC